MDLKEIGKWIVENKEPDVEHFSFKIRELINSQKRRSNLIENVKEFASKAVIALLFVGLTGGFIGFMVQMDLSEDQRAIAVSCKKEQVDSDKTYRKTIDACGLKIREGAELCEERLEKKDLEVMRTKAAMVDKCLSLK